ncbi:peptide-methionine (S)-S-oxide reductase MsrA [Candidatus Accumulibacter sp. ACC003]|uniref:peptide-methionine (S)-S-oxide reductase MsrA n=1 Tax=Candidatus Accumulibacter sp. ACC003 TaxID=2823334 RepID=UPI0025BAE659|nr:peptide-methionine (S)-S-oxide reductase MsrA [Candidatus Accumulibacter sp. ACC003]
MSGRLPLAGLAALGPLLLLLGADASAAELPAAKTAASSSAIFAAGCFWCSEADFEKVPGVTAVESGYTAGQTLNPTYEQVSSGSTGHTEAVRVFYDPQKISYGQLVEYFWRHSDPTARNRQFCDVGSQYRSGIYWQSENERKVVESSRDALLASGKLPRIETEIAAATTFYPAEEYHQDYYKKNPIRYAYYRSGCGRDQRIEKIWGSH